MIKRIRTLAHCLLVAGSILAIQTGECLAAEAGARAYGAAPTGLNVLQILYVHSEETGKNSSYNLKKDAEVLYYYKYIDLFGKTALVGGYIPRVDARLTIPASGVSVRNSGIGDPTLVIGIDLIGAPALDRKAYRQYRQETIIGTSLSTTMPLGEYNSASALNIGSNRWTFKPEIALSHALGNFKFDLYGSYTFYTDNRNYGSGLIKQQDGKWGIDSHLSYSITRGVWVALDYFRTWGGTTTINGVRQNNAVRDSVIGATLCIPLSRGFSLQGKYRESIETRSGAKTHTYRAKLQYVW